MRGRLSSKQMENAYIRSMVKHLTFKDPLDVDGGILKENATQNEESVSDIINGETSMSVSMDYFPTQKQKPSQQPKKQVRRRLHTSKPYQERLLNMAEARREIVTALKFHRASMKQQDAAATTTAAVVTANSYWPISTIIPPPPPLPPPPPPYDYDNENFVLPSQTLGLNLNFKNFSNLDTNLYHKPISIYSTSSTSSTPSSSSSAALYVPVGNPNSSGGLHHHDHHHHHHHAMDDDEMEEIKSLGEQHQIEWNDTMNLMTSARWCNFLKTMEIEAEEGGECDGCHQFDQVIKFPQWLINSNESSCLQQHFDDDFSDAYFQDPALPCMDIGEIEAMDGEWLA